MDTFLKTILILVTIMFVFGLRWQIQENNKCKEMGGVVVSSGSGVDNCWKDGQFIEVKVN